MQLAKNYGDEEGVDEELPGESDPDTVFKKGELGNFEPKEKQSRPGKHGWFYLIVTRSRIVTYFIVECLFVDIIYINC